MSIGYFYLLVVKFLTDVIEIFAVLSFGGWLLSYREDRRKWKIPVFLLLLAGCSFSGNVYPADFYLNCLLQTALIFLAFRFLLQGGWCQQLYIATFSVVIIIFGEVSRAVPLLIGGRGSVESFLLMAVLVVCMLRLMEILVWNDRQGRDGSGLGLAFSAFSAVTCMVVNETLKLWLREGREGELRFSIPLAACFCLLLLNMLFFVIYKKVISGQEKLRQAVVFQEKTQLEKLHYERLEEVYGNFRGLLHDMNRYLGAAAELENDRAAEQTASLGRAIRLEIQGADRNMYAARPVLNAILNEKEKIAGEKKISFSAFVEPGFDLEQVGDYDLIGIMSNLVDNALEAAQACGENRFVNIRMFAVNDGRGRFVRIENTMTGGVKERGGVFFTSKADRTEHGYGLRNVRSLVEKNGGRMQLKAEGNRFLAELIFC